MIQEKKMKIEITGAEINKDELMQRCGEMAQWHHVLM